MRRTIILTAATATVIATTFALRANTDRPTTATSLPHPTATVPATAATGPGPEATAVEVALRAVRSTGEVARAGFITRDDLIASLASARFAPTLRAASSAQLAQFTTAVGPSGVPAEQVVWEELPLTSHIVASSPSKARVSVWSVLIVGVPGLGAARQVWRTSTIDLVREIGGWKVDAWTATSGPTPTLATSESISDLPSIVAVLAWSLADGTGKR